MTEEFGRLLKEYRKENHLSQNRLLDLLHRHKCPYSNKGVISKWESGKQQPSAETIEILEDILHVSRGTFLDAAGKHEVADYYREENEQTKLVIRSVIEQEQKKHIDKIRELVTSWKSHLKLPTIIEVVRDKITVLQTPDNESLFASLKEHIPNEILWAQYTFWKSDIDKYIVSCNDVSQLVTKEIAQLPNDGYISPDAIFPILGRIEKRALCLKSDAHLFTMEKRSSVPPDEALFVLYPPPDEDGILLPYQCLCADGWDLFAPTDYQASCQAYQLMSDHLLESTEVNSLMNLLQELKKIEVELNAILHETLSSSSFIHYHCRLCPNRLKPVSNDT